MKRSGVISIIIPVYHESDIINDLINHIKYIDGEKQAEIIVADGAMEKDTLKSINSGKVKKVRSQKGRGVQMNTGANVANGKILLFLHSDTYLPEKAFELIRRTLSDDRISGGAFTIRFDRINPIFKMFMFIHDLRSIITRIPYGDQAIFIRKEVFEELKGYRDYPLFEDVDLMERMRRNKFKIRILKDKVITSGRRYRSFGAFRGLFRNLFMIFLYKMGVHPKKLEKFY